MSVHSWLFWPKSVGLGSPNIVYSYTIMYTFAQWTESKANVKK
jgi:hypothetical protein